MKTKTPRNKLLRKKEPDALLNKRIEYLEYCIGLAKDEAKTAIERIDYINGSHYDARILDIEKKLSNQIKEMEVVCNKVSLIEQVDFLDAGSRSHLVDRIYKLECLHEDMLPLPEKYETEKSVDAKIDNLHALLDKVDRQVLARVAHVEELILKANANKVGSRISQAFDLVKEELAHVSTPEQKTIIGEVLARLAMLS